jgi:quinol monooxygenase YgiN
MKEITLIGKFKVVNSFLGDSTKIINEVVSIIRNVSGNISSCIYKDINNKNTFFYIDKWISSKALDEYYKSEAFKKTILISKNMLGISDINDSEEIMNKFDEHQTIKIID